MHELTKWQTATVFISSTFKDMQYERDCINREVVPILNQFFLPYRIAIRVIDLRWGINTIDCDESNVEQSILKVCMNEIDRSRPLFIGLIGHRYGWIPDTSKYACSVTEMEIVYGAMRDSDSKKSSIFCLREPFEIPIDSGSIYFEDNIEKQNKVMKLREYICSEFQEYSDHIKRYKAKLDEKNGQVYDLADFKNFVVQKLTNIICENFSIEQFQNNKYVNNYLRLGNLFDSYIWNTTYIQRENDIEKSAIKKLEEQGVCFICGELACGKSSMLSYLYRTATNDSNTIALYYNATLSTGIHKMLELLNFWIYQLSKKLGYAFVETTYDVDVEVVLSRNQLVDSAVIEASKKLDKLCGVARDKCYNVVFYIDGINSIYKDKPIERLLDVIPAQPIFLIIDQNIKTNADCNVYLKPFTQNEIELYLRCKFNYYDKELHRRVVSTISEKVSNVQGNQLWLDIVSYLLLNLDADDFKIISETNAKTEEEKIETYFINLINVIPTDIKELFLFVYNKCIKYFNSELVYRSLKYISVSRIGLRDCDLQQLLGDLWNPIDFAIFRRWFSPFIIESIDNKCWKFKSPLFCESIYCTDIINNVIYEIDVANLLWSYNEVDPMRRSELFYNLLRCNMYERANKIILEENKNYAMSVKYYFQEIDYTTFENLYYSLLRSCKTDGERIIIASHILLHFKNAVFSENICIANRLIDKLLKSINYDGCNLSEYALISLSVLLENVIHYEVGAEKICYCESLYNINTIRCAKYPTEKSQNSLNKSIYILASCYMENNYIYKAEELFKNFNQSNLRNTNLLTL